MEPAAAPPGWYPNPQGPGLRWWDGSEWTDKIHAQYVDPDAADPAAAAATGARPIKRDSPLKILLGGIGAFLGAVAFFVGGIALIAVVVTLIVHPGSESSEPAPGGTEAAGLMEGSSDAECEVQLEALDQTAEILEARGEIPAGERAPSDVVEERWGGC
jgi:hypothetical protein